MKALLVNPYDLGRQPYALAQAGAHLADAGLEVGFLDLSLDRLDPAVLDGAQFVALYVGMHTGARIALEALPRIRARLPNATVCAFGLYAPVNEAILRARGVDVILGGESDDLLLAHARRALAGDAAMQPAREVALRQDGYRLPRRTGLPALRRYAHLDLPDGSRRVVGFTETTRGCKHLCRHCPVVPVYGGAFRAIPEDVVLADIRQLVAAGAQHVSFGDHDFWNGPRHALAIVQRMHREFPALSFDGTIKIEHLIRHAELLPEMAACGMNLVISAAESFDDAFLERLLKGHSGADIARAAELLRAQGIGFSPTFIPFHPWSSLADYRDLLARIAGLGLVHAVAPVQLVIRLLVPAGSPLFDIPGFERLVGTFDPRMLGHPWQHADARIDALQREVQAFVATAEGEGMGRGAIFAGLWARAHAALDEAAPALDETRFGAKIPALSEPWYCCAEPTDQQLQSL